MNQEESEHNEVDGMKKGADSTGEVMHIYKERLVICNEEDTDGQARSGFYMQAEQRSLHNRLLYYRLTL